MKETNENILIDALALLEQGKTQEEILALYPADRSALADFFMTMGELDKASKKIAPTPEFLQRIMRELPTHPRTSLVQRVFALPLFVRFAVPVALAIMIFVGVSYTQTQQPAISLLSEPAVENSALTSLAPAAKMMAPFAATSDSATQSATDAGQPASADAYVSDFESLFASDAQSQSSQDATMMAALDPSSDSYDQAFMQSGI
jgi:hypothetical protein